MPKPVNVHRLSPYRLYQLQRKYIGCAEHEPEFRQRYGNACGREVLAQAMKAGVGAINLDKLWKSREFKDVQKLAEYYGWAHSHTNGSHYIYKKQGVSLSIPRPRHGEIAKGTLQQIHKKIRKYGKD